MANYLKMAKVSAILTLRERGWSQRRIARELGIHPDTVGRYIRLSGRDPKPAQAPPGSEGSKQVKAPTGSGDANACNATSGCRLNPRPDCSPVLRCAPPANIPLPVPDGMRPWTGTARDPSRSIGQQTPSRTGLVHATFFCTRPQ